MIVVKHLYPILVDCRFDGSDIASYKDAPLESKVRSPQRRLL